MNQVTAHDLRKWNSGNKDYLLIDIREQWEREQFNIGGKHIPLGELVSRIDEIPRHKEVVLYCEKGIRSVLAIQRLEAAGFQNLFNLAGGMKAWKESDR
jgi:rhodanese-related sulfurtransferase